MTTSHNLRHRRAVAAAQRRAPAPLPQLAFDPFPGNGHHTTEDPDPFGFTDLFPPIGTDLPTSSSSSTLSSSSTSSSSTPSTTSTSSTPSTTSTSSTTSSVTTSQTSEIITTLPAQTAIVTAPVVFSSSSSSSAIGASSTSGASSSGSTGAVIGGIGAGIVAIAVIGFAVTYFIRRARKRDDDFDAGDFRGGARLIDDPPTHDDTVNHGFNPRPPTMIERHLASPAPTFGTQYGHPGPVYNHQEEYGAGYPDNHAGYGSSFQSYAPGQIMNMNNAAPSPIASSAHPMFTPSAYAQSPFSPLSPQYPVAENLTSPEAAAYPAAYPVLTRQGSSHSSEQQHQPGSPTALKRESAPTNDYVDLSRSSVSPYQAAQYVEISRRLNTEVPEGLPTAAIERELPPVPEKSPFADPGSVPPSPGGQYAIDRRNLETPSNRVSGESTASQTLDFPVPPSPVHTVSSRYRIDSMPPTLPEIHIESRVSVGNYPVIRNSGATDGGLSPGLTTGTGSRFPTTPSPLASSFGFPSPAPEATRFPEAAHPKLEPSPLSKGAAFNKKRGSMHSLYDAEDAYGGI